MGLISALQTELYESQPPGKRHHLTPFFSLTIRSITDSASPPGGDVNLTVADQIDATEIRFRELFFQREPLHRGSVAPRQVTVALGQTQSEDETVSWTPSVQSSPHLFVLGIPGQGKSVTVNRILQQFAKHRLGAGREGVCYVGLVFKQDDKHKDPRTACCAAQMFLDSGDGVVFKGAVGPWYREKRGMFHLSRPAAAEVIRMCVESFKARSNGTPPAELFIHGRVRFEDDEWNGFLDGAAGQTKVVGVRITEDEDLKVFRRSDYPILRGQFFPASKRKGSLWTRGFVPRLRSYPGLEVPNPIFIDVCRGDADLDVVARDVLALTKLNYNACVFADGVPVTLKFAKAVGEILTAGPLDTDVAPLPFKHYI